MSCKVCFLTGSVLNETNSRTHFRQHGMRHCLIFVLFFPGAFDDIVFSVCCRGLGVAESPGVSLPGGSPRVSDCCSLVWLCRQRPSLFVNVCLKQQQQGFFPQDKWPLRLCAATLVRIPCGGRWTAHATLTTAQEVHVVGESGGCVHGGDMNSNPSPRSWLRCPATKSCRQWAASRVG